MKNINSKKLFQPALIIFMLIISFSCDDFVEDGYRVDYPPSSANLEVEAIGYESGAVGDVVSYKITAQSGSSIKSLVIQTNNPGANGTGFDVGAEGFDDPFADHIYGTVKDDITSFTVKYDYIIPEGINKSKLTFSLIDQEGKVSSEANLKVVSAIKKYNSRSIYAKNNLYNDAFATIDGVIYPDIKTNFSTTSEENLAVQEKIDIFFYVSNSVAIISSPADNGLDLELDVENQTKFKKLTSVSNEDFANLTAASLVELTKADSIGYHGSSRVSGIRVGDIIGFTTDLNALHSFKTGLIKVKELHPALIDRYSGTAYMMEFDVVTQIDEQ